MDNPNYKDKGESSGSKSVGAEKILNAERDGPKDAPSFSSAAEVVPAASGANAAVIPLAPPNNPVPAPRHAPARTLRCGGCDQYFASVDELGNHGDCPLMFEKAKAESSGNNDQTPPPRPHPMFFDQHPLYWKNRVLYLDSL